MAPLRTETTKHFEGFYIDSLYKIYNSHIKEPQESVIWNRFWRRALSCTNLLSWNVVKELSLDGSLNLRIVIYCTCTPKKVFQKGTQFSNSLKMISIGHIITFTKTRKTPKCVPRVCLVEVTFFDQFCFSFDKHRVKFLSQKSPKHIISFCRWVFSKISVFKAPKDCILKLFYFYFESYTHYYFWRLIHCLKSINYLHSNTDNKNKMFKINKLI